MLKCLTVFLLVLLFGCAEQKNLAPVVELKWQPQKHSSNLHRVSRGETLYAIAFTYDKDYRDLAAYNHLNPPYALRIGQVLYLTKPLEPARVPRLRPKVAERRAIIYPSRSVKRPPQSPRIQEKFTYKSNGKWLWPAKGRIVANFKPDQGKKGIDIAGEKGAKVFASASGTVAYAGAGLSGYGNLIIIKHEGPFLTAYGNNLRNHVHEGERVKAGQMIAEMGEVDHRFWGVHFEIRKAGQPVNPLTYLR